MITNFKIFQIFESSYVIVMWEEKIIKALTTGVLSHFKNIFLDDVNVDDIDNSWTPLMLLAYHSNRTIGENENSFELFKMLIDRNADWNITNDENEDFIDILNHEKLSEPLKNKIIEHYPEKYKEYLIKKETEKYNL